MSKKKLLYIEISTAHTEIIWSFVEALSNEYVVHLLINEKSLPRIQHLSDKIMIATLRESHFLGDIIAYKNKFKPDLILLNSAQGRRIRDLSLRLFFDKTPIVGVHHNAENLYKSFTQKIIHFKIKKYVVLANFIKEHLKDKTKVKIEVFYPLSYQKIQAKPLDSQLKYIAIPGVLEQDRRDYFGFIEIIKEHQQKLDPNLKFVLLGNSKNHDGPQVLRLIQQNNLQDRFILFNSYVEDDLMLSYAQSCIAIMPLMHPGTRWFDKYFETKISGSYNLAFAFDKVLLMHEIFRGKNEFRQHGIFYNQKNFSSVVESLTSLPPIEKPVEFQFEVQKNQLLSFLS